MWSTTTPMATSVKRWFDTSNGPLIEINNILKFQDIYNLCTWFYVNLKWYNVAVMGFLNPIGTILLWWTPWNLSAYKHLVTNKHPSYCRGYLNIIFNVKFWFKIKLIYSIPKNITLRTGFEPARPKSNGFPVYLLYHSDITPLQCNLIHYTGPVVMLHKKYVVLI